MDNYSLLEKELEFAKLEIANLHDDIHEWMDKCDALCAEIECLRARIEEMDKQEPVATVIKEGDSRYWMSERLWTFPDGKYPLYALPGAKGEEK